MKESHLCWNEDGGCDWCPTPSELREKIREVKQKMQTLEHRVCVHELLMQALEECRDTHRAAVAMQDCLMEIRAAQAEMERLAEQLDALRDDLSDLPPYLCV